VGQTSSDEPFFRRNGAQSRESERCKAEIAQAGTREMRAVLWGSPPGKCFEIMYVW
jgi:hypothetical protein